MRDRSYYVSQAAQCRQLSLQTSDALTAARLNEMAREYDVLVSDLARLENAPALQPELAD